MNRRALLALLLAQAGAACSGAAEPIAKPPLALPDPVHYTYRIARTYPHDPGAFTQGLVFADGHLYEGTGNHGQSSLRKVELETGRVLQQRDLPDRFFGEGITLHAGRILQLTLRANVGFVYDRETFELRGEFQVPTEGWGLTHDGERLIRSDGTETLFFLDPESFQEIGRLQVTDRGEPVVSLNELEYVNGEIWANVWQTERIARISPATGQVLGWIELAGLLSPEVRVGTDVLNGIAHDPASKRIFVTGKWWPSLFEIEVVPALQQP